MVFNPLEKEDIKKIVSIELAKLITRVEKLGYQLSLTEKAKDFLVEKGYDKKYGARPLSRAIQKHVEDQIAEEIVSNQIEEGDHIHLDWDKEKLKLTKK